MSRILITVLLFAFALTAIPPAPVCAALVLSGGHQPWIVLPPNL